FASLEIDLGNTGWPLIDQKVGEFVDFGAEPVQPAVVPAHAAINAVLAAVIGNFNDPPNEGFPAELLPSNGCGGLMELLLVVPRADQISRLRIEIRGATPAI